MSKTLSKSKYISGLQCTKRLWLELHDPDKAPPISEVQQRLFDQGKEVGELAQTHFPGGLLIESEYFNLTRRRKLTMDAIESGESVLFEGTFFYDDIFVLSDILTKNDDGSWDIITILNAPYLLRLCPSNLHLRDY